MNNLKSVLKGDPTEWLLERDNPSVRYFTFTDILDRHENDPEATKTKPEIMKTGVVPQILAKQKNGGYWEAPEAFYTATNKGTGMSRRMIRKSIIGDLIFTLIGG